MSFFRNKRVGFYLRRAVWIMIAWVIISNLLFFYDLITLYSRNALDSNFDFLSAFQANLIVAVSAGFIGGLITVNLMEYWLRKYAFWKALLLIVVIYTLTAIIISFIGAAYLASVNFELAMWNSEVIEEASFIFGSWLFIKNFVIWLIIVLVTLIVLMINDKYGPGVFPDYLRGKYFLPKREERIFMFADIKDATTTAEILGEEKYFNFLKDFFKDITPAIVESSGEIYQYVGDEIVVSWKMKKGLKKCKALLCFFHMKKLIDKKAHIYTKKYGIVPEFKVGYHFGQVMVGELGQIKREIAFSGDVLNTTSRIQAKCNELNVDILASEAFKNIHQNTLPQGLLAHSMGAQTLKGKANVVVVTTFRYET
ncbi:MAG: adenylate/guanylate cyclase domain-containing protein [Flavobacteriaceae bacterium]|nr:adenylate/guanylate cyclase domain-containing protein [Flavobacteriaceae bacterium]